MKEFIKRKVGRPRGSFIGIHPRKANGKATKTYQAWLGMIARCHGNHPSAKYYRGKGITVCDQWRGKDGFDIFLADIGVAPEGLWIDRINNAGNYEPGNVRWVAPNQSAKNRNQGGKLKIDPTSLRQRAIAAGLDYHTVYQRVKLRGWSEDVALSTPSRKQK